MNLRVTNGANSCAERVPWNVLIENKNKGSQGKKYFKGSRKKSSFFNWQCQILKNPKKKFLKGKPYTNKNVKLFLMRGGVIFLFKPFLIIMK